MVFTAWLENVLLSCHGDVVLCVKVMLCKAPEDLLLVTFNHLDAIREMVSGSDKLVATINDAHRQLRGVSYVYHNICKTIHIVCMCLWRVGPK